MIYLQFITNAPLYVWGILVGLITMGVLLSQDRKMSPMRLSFLPIAMISYSLYGVIADFGISSIVMISWVVGIALAFVAGAYMRLPKGVEYDELSGRFLVRGSWLPLALMMIIFVNKYIIGVLKALSLPIMADTTFMVVICALYGCYSGIFLARSWVIMQAKYP